MRTSVGGTGHGPESVNASPSTGMKRQSAQVVSGFSASANGTNVAATLESGDPMSVDNRSTMKMSYRQGYFHASAVAHNVCYTWLKPS